MWWRTTSARSALRALPAAALLILCAERSEAQAPPTSQCVTTAVAGGTGDAITTPRLPCVPTTTLLLLTISNTNATATPTLQPQGSPIMPIVNADGSALSAGVLKPGLRTMMTSNGQKWFWLNNTNVLSLTTACPSIVDFGGLGDGVRDNTTAWGNAVAAGVRCLAVPGGDFYFAGDIAYAMTPGSAYGFALRGAGSSVSSMHFAAGHGLTITYQGHNSAATITGLSFLAEGVNSGTALSLLQTSVLPASENAMGGQTMLQDLQFRGADGFAGAKCWATGVMTNYVSNINFQSDNFFGCYGTSESGNGIGIDLDPTPTAGSFGIVYNIVSCNFQSLQYGVRYGQNIQGVTISGGSNFLSDTVGEFIPGTAFGGRGQNTVIGNQFGFNGTAILDQPGVDQEISGNLIYIVSPGDQGINSETKTGFMNSNVFYGSTTTNTTAIVLNASAVVGGSGSIAVNGNQISNVGTGIFIGAGSANMTVEGNNFWGNTHNIVNNSLINTVLITGGTNTHTEAYASVVGAANNGAGLVRLALDPSQGTGQFATGMSVLVSGVGGLEGIGLNGSSLFTTINVVDATHVDLLNVSFNGTYTFGGQISTLP